MVTVNNCSVRVLHSITLGILIDSEQIGIGLLGFGWRVAGYVAGIPVVWTDVGLEDAGLLLNVCWERCSVSGWNSSGVYLEDVLLLEVFVGVKICIGLLPLCQWCRMMHVLAWWLEFGNLFLQFNWMNFFFLNFGCCLYMYWQ